MSDKNISKIKEYAKEQSIEDTIGMILSNRVDYGGEQGGMVSVKRFNQVAKDLIEIFPQLKAIQVQAKVKVNFADIEKIYEDNNIPMDADAIGLQPLYYTWNQLTKFIEELNFYFEKADR